MIRSRHGNPARKRACALLALIVSLACVPWIGKVSAQARPNEYAVKAAYLLNFGRFVKWPESGAVDFQVCVLGSDPFGKVLDSTVAGESIDGRAVTINRISSVGSAGSCHVIFIAESERARVPAILAALRGRHVLTVSDLPGFVESGGDIGFVLQNNRVRFAVNLNSTEENGLNVSSDLLRVALSVISGKRSQG